MARQIVIDFDAAADVHRVRNFGEDLYRACEEHGWASISLHDVDRATTQLRVTVRSARHLSRISAMIEKLLGKHHFTDSARLTHVKSPN